MTTHMNFHQFLNEETVAEVRDYPAGYHPELLERWPVSGDLVVPIELLPENLRASMGAQWRLKQKNQKILDEQNKK